MIMKVEQSMEWELAAETEVLGENLPPMSLVHHKSHVIWPGLDGKPATNRRSLWHGPPITIWQYVGFEVLTAVA
jgi:hypothetical protein